MRRVIAACAGTIVGLIMLLSFKSHAPPTTVTARQVVIGDPATATTTTSTALPVATGAGAVATTTTTTITRGNTVTTTVTGNAAATRYGPVTVEVTITGGRVTAVDAIQYPTAKSRDRQINARAVPQLNQEALNAQSARLDVISGATYTSVGYMTSLQSALDKAGLG